VPRRPWWSASARRRDSSPICRRAARSAQQAGSCRQLRSEWNRPSPRSALPLLAHIASPTDRTRDRFQAQCFVDLDPWAQPVRLWRSRRVSDRSSLAWRRRRRSQASPVAEVTKHDNGVAQVLSPCWGWLSWGIPIRSLRTQRARTHPPSAPMAHGAANAISSVAALTDDPGGKLFAVGQTVGQSVRTVADISHRPDAPDATLARASRHRFCPDTEEVTGSNPVSPTSIIPCQARFWIRWERFRTTYAQDLNRSETR
jgi:hypothetical protein